MIDHENPFLDASKQPLSPWEIIKRAEQMAGNESFSKSEIDLLNVDAWDAGMVYAKGRLESSDMRLSRRAFSKATELVVVHQDKEKVASVYEGTFVGFEVHKDDDGADVLAYALYIDFQHKERLFRSAWAPVRGANVSFNFSETEDVEPTSRVERVLDQASIAFEATDNRRLDGYVDKLMKMIKLSPHPSPQIVNEVGIRMAKILAFKEVSESIEMQNAIREMASLLYTDNAIYDINGGIVTPNEQGDVLADKRLRGVIKEVKLVNDEVTYGKYTINLSAQPAFVISIEGIDRYVLLQHIQEFAPFEPRYNPYTTETRVVSPGNH